MKRTIVRLADLTQVVRNPYPVWNVQPLQQQFAKEDDDDDDEDPDDDDDDEDEGGDDDKPKPKKPPVKKAPAKKPAEDDEDDDDDDSASADKRNAKKWEKRAKSNFKALNAIKAALNGGEDDTPEQLAERLGTTETKAKVLLQENAVLKAANKAGVDAEELTDSKSFMASVDELDPESDDFAKDVAALVKEKAKGIGKTRTRKAGSSGGRNGSGKSETSQLDRDDLKNMSAREIEDARKAGRLNAIMGIK